MKIAPLSRSGARPLRLLPALSRPLACGSVAVLCLLGGSPAAHAQSTDGSSWLGVGAGAAAPLEDAPFADPAFAAMIHLGHQRGAHLFSLRGLLVAELLADSYYDLGLLYGRGRSEGSLLLSASAGVGMVLGPQRAGEPTDMTVGIPAEVRAIFRPRPSFGLGVTGFTNLNRTRRLLGATLSAEVRRLR